MWHGAAGITISWIHHKNRTQAKKIRVSHTKIQRNGSSNRAKSMVGAFHHTNDECEGSNRSAILHEALHNTGMLPSYKQTLHAWLLTTLPPTVQTPCKNSIAFPNASLCGDKASDATFMLPGPRTV